MNKFYCEHVISLGYFCSPALELDRLGYRNASYPFDWVISNTRSVSRLINSNFNGLFDMEYLKNGEEIGSYVKVHHTKYRFSFFHDFKKKIPLLEQIDLIKEKYQRRINRFYGVVKSGENVAFLMYVNNSSQEDIDILINNLSTLTKNFRVIIICNDGCKYYRLNKFILTQIFVRPDINDTVCRKFFENQTVLNEFQQSITFPIEKQISNVLKKGINIQLVKETEYQFNEMRGEYSNLFLQGWGRKENHGRWTVDKISILNLLLSEHSKEAMVIFSFKIRSVFTDAELKIVHNHTVISHQVNGNELILALPFSKNIQLYFSFEGEMTSPKDRGINSDTRLLGYLFASFCYKIEK